MFKKIKHCIGLEIGDGLVKAIYIQSNAKENRLIDFDMQAVDFRQGRQGIINAIKDVLGRLSLKKKMKVNISVSGESVVVRDIHWPQMSPEEIRKALQYEVERQVHYKAEEIVFDYYSVLDKSIAETKTRVVLVAAKKELIENYSSLISSAGYDCGYVEVDTFSLLNCFYLNGPKAPEEKTIAIINVGMEVTNIDVIKGKIVGLTKDAFVAWSNLIDALPIEIDLDFNNLTVLKGLNGSDDIYELCLFILNALSNQIRRTIEFYESQGRDTVEEIFLSGRIAMIKNLDKYLQNILGLKVTPWNPIAKLQYDQKVFIKKKLKENALMLAICTGLACYRAFNIDLSSQKKKNHKNKVLQFIGQYKGLAIFFGFLVFFLIGLWTIFFGQVQIKEKNKTELFIQAEELKKVIQEIENLKKGRQILNEHMQIIKAILSHRISWSKVLYVINLNLPNDIWLTEINLKEISKPVVEVKQQTNIFDRIPSIIEKTLKNRTLYIRGIAYSESAEKMLSQINGFLNNLRFNEEFNNNFGRIELIRSFRDTLGEIVVMRFEIECALK